MWENRCICIDTWCVFGGALTALRWPEQELVSVPADREYAVAKRPLKQETGDREQRTGSKTDPNWSASGADGIRIATSGGRSPEWDNRTYEPEAVWAYQPIRQPPLPTQARSASEGNLDRNPIDAFLLEALRKKGIDGFAPPTFAFGDTNEYSRTREFVGYSALNVTLRESGLPEVRVATRSMDHAAGEFDFTSWTVFLKQEMLSDDAADRFELRRIVSLVFHEARHSEQDFLVRLLIGELRQGAVGPFELHREVAGVQADTDPLWGKPRQKRIGLGDRLDCAARLGLQRDPDTPARVRFDSTTEASDGPCP